MGYSYTVHPGGHDTLDCDACPTTGGVRKHRCPVGWCPSIALCTSCAKAVKADGRWANWHATCPASSARYHASLVAGV